MIVLLIKMFCIIFIWHVIGGGVLGFIDKDERLIEWYENCPKKYAWWLQPLIITSWPILVYFYFRGNKNV